MIKRLFFIFLVIVILPCAALADKYVSSTGNDTTGDGSVGNPWATPGYALTDTRMDDGETLYLMDGATYSAFYSTDTNIDVSFATSGSTVTVTSYGPTTATIDVPSNCASRFIYLYNKNYTLIFQNVNITNSGNVAVYWAQQVGGGSTLRFYQCPSIDFGTGNYFTIYYSNLAGACTTEFIECPSVKGGHSTKGLWANYNTNGGTFKAESTVFNGVSRVYAQQASTIDISNNTIVKTLSERFLDLNAAGNDLTWKNNIWQSSATNKYMIYASATAIADIVANRANYDVTNSDIWSEDDVADEWHKILFYSATDLITLDSSNVCIDPGFTDYDSDDFTISASSNLRGWGSHSDLPTAPASGTWAGNDIGAYPNPASSKPSLSLSGVALVGDSIMNGSGLTGSDYPWAQLDALGVDAIDGPNTCAESGAKIDHMFWMIDKVMSERTPATVVLGVGINNLVGGFSPSNEDADSLAAAIKEIMDKVEAWGATPTWAGVGSLTGAPPTNTNPEAVEAAVGALCRSNGWRYGSWLKAMQYNASWQTDYFADLSSNLHPNANGAEIIANIAYALVNGWTWTPYDFRGTGPHNIHRRPNAGTILGGSW